MKKHAEHEAEAPVPENRPDEATAMDAEKKNPEGAAPAVEGTTPDAQNGKKDGDAKGESADKGSTKAPDTALRVAELEKKCAELQDQYLRKAADFDNYRKRMIKEKQDAIDFANSNLLVDLVEVLDNFDRAIASAGTAEAGTPAAAFVDGIAMIRTQLGSMLETKYNLAYYPAKGSAFDPNLHEAIATAVSPDVTEATVVEEFVKGYKLKDRIIRHAKVMVHTPA